MANVLNSKTGSPEPEPHEPEEENRAPLLEGPRDGVPPVVKTAEQLARVVADFARGQGPVAVDAERASGYRYSQRAYLVQLRRSGAGSALVDPVACPDLSELDSALSDAEMVLHAAHQDLPCLDELSLRPGSLFDTELAGRLLGYQRVGLGTMVERFVGVRLAKEHSAVDWSVRPLPEEWLSYAALDVEVLTELRDALHKELAAAGKLEWAQEEFAAVLSAPPKEPRAEPWRRTSGIHRVRNQRALGAVRELWQERDRIARERDVAPGRVVPDSGLVEAAITMPRTERQLIAVKPFGVRLARRYVPSWIKAVNRVRNMPDADLPRPGTPGDGPPPTNRWADRDPAAAQRLESARARVRAIAEQVTVPAENLLPPDAVRRLCWTPPATVDVTTVSEHLRQNNAREWQISLTAGELVCALKNPGN